ncbi:MAG: helix-turn-helix transcriptional regulator [Actinobacteria bacterium]|nr:helix-turn-helix transcriptional regulator [Actinomycetota bacterium]
MPPTPTPLGDLLRTALRVAGLSQTQLAKSVGVSQQTVSKWLTGETQPRPRLINSLAGALGVDPTDLSAALVATEDAPLAPQRAKDVRVAALDRRIRDLSPDQLERLEAYVQGLEDGSR